MRQKLDDNTSGRSVDDSVRSEWLLDTSERTARRAESKRKGLLQRNCFCRERKSSNTWLIRKASLLERIRNKSNRMSRPGRIMFPFVWEGHYEITIGGLFPFKKNYDEKQSSDPEEGHRRHEKGKTSCRTSPIPTAFLRTSDERCQGRKYHDSSVLRFKFVTHFQYTP